MRREFVLALGMCAATLLAVAPGGALADGADWGAIEPATQTLLAPLRDGWGNLSPGDRQHLLANARHWQTLSKTEQQALLQRQSQWLALPPTARAQQRARYAAWEKLTPDEQARVRAAAARFAALPGPQQGALRARFSAQAPDWQSSWLLGPAVGVWLDQAGTWFSYVPDGERSATLRMLEDLPAPARAQLFTVSRRLGAAQREQLRKNLLAAAPAQRAALIANQLMQ
ncbi:MAG: DUF3106 domain-containing protein [Proteobacteria bacterium]|nr:DUF3106 domain-containing protein [Pseudomonadota bacterium]